MGVDQLKRDFQFNVDANLWSLKEKAGAFTYSDGDENENYLLSVMQKASDHSFMSEELTLAMKDWPSTYHLHHQRCNLFRPLVGHLKGPILEIGAGCGVLTRFLGEQGHQVFALEGSVRRASIIGARCRDLDNVSVVNANFQDFLPQQKFQTITLIGVLEYARLFFADGSGTDPVDQMLRRVAGMIAPDGVLIVAIENQMGLKYFAGYPEDHLGKPMTGIEGHYTDNSVVTFGRQELSDRLSRAGLPHQRFAYPVPDYKFPEAVLFEEAMSGPQAGRYAPMVAGALASDRQKPKHVTFRISRAIGTVMKNGMGSDMANSFLAMSSPSPESFSTPEESSAVYYGNGDRKKAYLKEVRFTEIAGKVSVTRRPLTESIPHSDATVVQVLNDESFASGTLWIEALQDILLQDNWTLKELAEWARVWTDTLQAQSGHSTSGSLSFDTIIDGTLLDAIPKNLIVDENGTAQFVDLEWNLTQPLDLGFVIVRGLSDALNGVELASKSNEAADITTMIGAVCTLLGFAMPRDMIEDRLAREHALQVQISNSVGRNNRLRFLRTQISYRSLNKFEKRRKNFQRLLHKIRHPIQSFFKRASS